MVIELAVNGRRSAVTAEPTTPLLHVLRNELGLRGTRFGCGAGYCGACMVLVDGRPVQSCDLPISAVGDAPVTTIEGLADTAPFEALRQAFVDEQAGQCGYCLSGILISATALLENRPRPERIEIAAALDANLCRCGAHHRILRAVARAVGADG